MVAKALVRRLFCVITIVIAAETAAQACSSGKDAYDDIYSPETLIVRALITSLDVKMDIHKMCWSTKYDVREIFWGKLTGPLEVSICSPRSDHDGVDKEQVGGDLEENGWKKGTEVIAGFTTKPPLERMKVVPQPAGMFRLLAVPCRPFHVRIDNTYDSERLAVLEEFRDSIREHK
ncbi:hypothetical protein ACSBOB_21565 [Mesorhizobium sp. ASY16-5R]|uniref:hypothetical protein n=1 Tax=Mesorhizobium sp. ASY16-5R TaxID=3445772 RepID=UPI003FA11324